MASEHTPRSIQVPAMESSPGASDVVSKPQSEGHTMFDDLVVALWRGGQPSAWPTDAGNASLGRHDAAPRPRPDLEIETWQTDSLLPVNELLASMHIGEQTHDAMRVSAAGLVVLAVAIRVLGAATVARLLQSTAVGEASIAGTGITGSYIVADGKRWVEAARRGDRKTAQTWSDAMLSKLFPFAAFAARNVWRGRNLARTPQPHDPTVIDVPGRSLVPVTPATLGPPIAPFGGWLPVVPTKFFSRDLSPVGNGVTPSAGNDLPAGEPDVSLPVYWDARVNRELIKAAKKKSMGALTALEARNWKLQIGEFRDPKRVDNPEAIVTTVTLLDREGKVLTRTVFEGNIFPKQKHILDDIQGLDSGDTRRGAFAAVALDQLGTDALFMDDPWIARPRPLGAQDIELVTPIGEPTHEEIKAYSRDRPLTVGASISTDSSGVIHEGTIANDHGIVTMDDSAFRFFKANGVLEFSSIHMRPRGLGPANIDRVAKVLESISYDLWRQGVRVIQTKRLRVGHQPEQPWKYVLPTPQGLDKMAKPVGLPTQLIAETVELPGGVGHFTIRQDGSVIGQLRCKNGGVRFSGSNHELYENGVLEVPHVNPYVNFRLALDPTLDEVMQQAVEALNDPLWERGVRVIQTPIFEVHHQTLKPWEYRLKPPRGAGGT